MSAFLSDVPAGYVTNGVPYPAGQPNITLPLKEQNNYARIWEQPFIVSGNPPFGAVSLFSGNLQFQTGISTTGNGGLFVGSYIAAESDRTALGGDLNGFVRSYAELPSGHNSFESYGFIFPGLLIATASRPAATKTVVSRIAHDFVYSTNPQALPLSGAQRFLYLGLDTTTLSAATVPTAVTYSGWIAAGTEFVAEDGQLHRYAGNIWDRQTRWIKAK